MGLVTGDRVKLVERASGMSEPAAGNHRHIDASCRQHRSQHQTDLVADSAGRMFVNDRRVQFRPLQNVAGIAHGKSQVFGFAGVKSV